MRSAIVFETKNANNYLYMESLKCYTLLHPVLVEKKCEVYRMNPIYASVLKK